MSRNPHVPQSGRGDQDDELSVWPVYPSLSQTHDLNSTFVGRLNYCQRLAARVGGLRGLGFGWRSITFACLGPVFDLDRLSRGVDKDLVMSVFDRLDELRNKLVEQEGLNVNLRERSRISSGVQLLVSRLFFPPAKYFNMLAPAARAQCMRVAS